MAYYSNFAGFFVVKDKMMEAWKMALLTDTKKEFGSIPPQWVVYPKFHPDSMGWRMGEGESYAMAWSSWWEEQHFTFEQKLAYFCQYDFPKAWLKNLIYMLYKDELIEEFGEDDSEDIAEDELIPYFERLEKLGFGSFDEWKKDVEEEQKWE